MSSKKLCIYFVECFMLYLRKGWSINLRAIENCICSLLKMRSILRTVQYNVWPESPLTRLSARFQKYCTFSAFFNKYKLAISRIMPRPRVRGYLIFNHSFTVTFKTKLFPGLSNINCNPKHKHRHGYKWDAYWSKNAHIQVSHSDPCCLLASNFQMDFFLFGSIPLPNNTHSQMAIILLSLS